MDTSQIVRVGQMWHDALRDKRWRGSDRTKLALVSRELVNNDLRLSRVRFLLDELLSNRFFKSSMAVSYAKHERELRAQIKSLEVILTKRKAILGEMRRFYFTKQQFTLMDGSRVECEIGKSKVAGGLDEILGKYSFELVGGQFDKHVVNTIATEINQELKDLTNAELTVDISAFLLKLAGSQLDEIKMVELIDKLVPNLMATGHTEDDLGDVGRLLSSGEDEARTRKVVESLLRAVPTRWIVLTSVDDLTLSDDKNVNIGKVMLHGVDHDFASICDRIRESDAIDEVKEMSIKSVKDMEGKVSAELEIPAYGSKVAWEKAAREISNAVDVLAVHDPNFVIREPREQPHHRMAAFDSDHGMLPAESIGSRVEISVKKQLTDKSIQSLQHLLTRLDKVLKKDAESLNDFERRILSAMHFYRKGTYAFDPLDKIVNYFVALECMLIMHGERPSRTLPNRVLDILGVMQENVREVRNLVKNAYRHRGEILHMGYVSGETSKQIVLSLFEIDRMVLSILVDHLQNRRCDSLENFLNAIQEETIANRENVRKTALLEINKEFLGEGLLKNSDGGTMGQVEFSFVYKDDDKYVYKVGTISRFKAFGPLSGTSAQSIEEVTFRDRRGKFIIRLADPLHPLTLFALLRGEIESIAFQATELSSNLTPEKKD